MASDHQHLVELTARVMRHVDLRNMSESDRADMMGALTQLAAYTPAAGSSVLAAAVAPALRARHPLCTPLTPDACSAAYIDDNGLSHVCSEAPQHDGQHLCACGVSWGDVVIPQDPAECGVSRDAGFGHVCVCHLGVHNLVPGPDLVEVPLHACAACGQPWTA